MRKIWLAAAAILFIFSSCDTKFLPAPYMPPLEDNQNGNFTPVNISASHGEKRSIIVSWDPVPNAVLYYIYRTESPLELFTLCAETTSNFFTFNVPPGSSVYYRVSSVIHDGTESARSSFVLGTSLAQPVISDITDISEDSAAVTWYMENASDATYRDHLWYIIHCFNGNADVAQIILEASAISENRAIFTGLNANTKYEYQVEAYLFANQTASEISDKMDAPTARRFRPGPPVDLRAARGTSVDKIELTFELPDMVDIALGDNTFDPKPLYFTISKRLYSESGNNEYQLVCPYFGIVSETAAVKNGGRNFSEYNPGYEVTWTDDNIVRGITYEYRVQSYVDNTNRVISSDLSRANTLGWALSSGEVTYGKVEYEINASGVEYTAAVLPIHFDFNPKDEQYTYTVITKVTPIDDTEPRDPSFDFSVKTALNSLEDVKNFKIHSNLTQKSSASSPGRGIYSVEIEVRLPGSDVLICTFTALGSVQISEDTQPIVADNFHIQDGYADKFVLMWDNYSNRKYTIEESVDKNNWNEIASINTNPDDDSTTFVENYSYTVTGQDSGITKYFRIKPARFMGDNFKYGQAVYAPAAQTLGVPELTLDGSASYSLITPVWSEAQRADTYRIKYKYTEDGENAEYKIAAFVKKEDLTVDATGKNFRFSFRPEGYNNAQIAGKEMEIVVEALNENLRTAVGGAEISTYSKEDVRTHKVGPALLNAAASRAASPQDIGVSWDSIPGASGYYIFRRQFNMNNTAEEGTESVVYYVPASTSSPIEITGKDLALDASNSRTDTKTVKASASISNKRYTLRDMYLNDSDYFESAVYNRHKTAYRDQQNDIVQGFSYRYYVVPVVTGEPLNSIEFMYNKDGSNKNTSIASYTIREHGYEINYSGAAALECDGFTIGFGQNVTATKGAYSSSGNINDGIRITWTSPPRLSLAAGFTPRYIVYRRTSGSSVWNPVTTVNNVHFYIDTPQDRGIAYEYAIGIENISGGNASVPFHSNRFIASCVNMRDERDRPNMLGFMLGMVKMESVSRTELFDAQDNFAEDVKWYSAGISNSYNSQNHNWGIDGYDVFVMNRNIDANWHRIADMTSIPNQINLNVRVSDVQGGSTLQGGLLKVLRDYRHYFKVRSYVFMDDEKIYSPDPDWDYQILFAQTTNRTNQDRANFLETDYVKWGARQISHVELVRAASIVLAWGIDPSSWQSTIGGSTEKTNGNNGSSGEVYRESSSGVGWWWYDFRNYKPDMDTNANRNNWTYSVTFLTVHSNSNMSGSTAERSRTIVVETSGAGGRPRFYGALENYRSSIFSTRYNYGTDFFNVNGPSCLNGLYNAQMRFYNDNTSSESDSARSRRFQAGSANPGDGHIEVRYPVNAGTTVKVRGGVENTALMFNGQNSNNSRRGLWY